jgi:hypothetical protein
MERKPSPVVFLYDLGCIRCNGCLQKTPLGKKTRHDPLELARVLSMAAEVHADCVGLEPQPAAVRRSWREGWLRQRYSNREVYGV